jgi:hypothetical protein
MQLPPLMFSDVSLFLAVCAIVLLLAAELSSPYYGQTTLTIDRRKLKNVAYVTGIFFLTAAFVTIIQILLK